MIPWRTCLDFGICTFRKHETKARFLIVGGINTALGLAAYPVLYLLLKPLNLHYLVILTISQAICITTAFITNKFWVFKTTGNYLPEYGKFLAFHLIYFLVNLLVLPLMVVYAKMDPLYAQPLFAVMVIISSYFWHSRITFTRSKGAVNGE